MRREYETGLLQMRILWAVSKGKRYGYEILKFLNSRQDSVRHPNLYSSLRKLEQLGLLSSEKTGRTRVYRITDEGRREFRRIVESFLRMYDGIFRDYVCSLCKEAEK